MNSRFCITRTRTTNAGRTVVEFLAGGEFPEFTTPGNTRTGVGVANLKTWGTVKGAQRWMDARPTFQSGASKVGIVEIVPVIGGSA